jgi:hypothetical protein
MNMSLYELYVWLTELDFPSLFAIWTWLITAPWWLAILTVMFVIFAVRLTWDMTFYFLNWVFDWTFRAGIRFGRWVQAVKGYIGWVIGFGKLVKERFFR